MNNATLVETLRPLPRTGRVRLAAQVERLRKACDADSALEPFLEETLEILGRMFGATAGAFWFRPWGGAGLCPSVRAGFTDLPYTAKALNELDESVARSWQQASPLVRRHSELGATVLVGPIRDGQEAVGAVQLIVLDQGDHDGLDLVDQVFADQADGFEDEQTTTGTTGQRGMVTAYRRGLAGVLMLVQPALLKRMRVNSVPIQQAEEGLQILNQQIAGMQRSIRLAIERYLQQLSGANFGSLEDNQRFAKSVQELLDSHGLRVRCPECGHPAILRCSRNASITTGAFVFDHYLPEGRTFHGGGRLLPPLRTIAKPSRKQTSS